MLIEDELILYSFGIEPDFLRQQLKKRSEIQQFTAKFPNQASYEIVKSENLTEFLKCYIIILFEEFKSIISNLENFKCQSYSKSEKQNDFIINSSLQEEFYNNKIKKTRTFFFEELEKAIGSNISKQGYEKAILQEFLTIRAQAMNKINPKIILRNFIAQEIIEEAEKGDYKAVDNLLNILLQPFEDYQNFNFEAKYTPNLDKAYSICVSCSS